jgi:hypothetical protein
MPELLGYEPYRPRVRAGCATLPAKAGWRACHRARSLDATLDSMQFYIHKYNICSSYCQVFS